VKSINDEYLSLMKKAGCYKIELGIESGNNDILKKMRKKITIEEALIAAQKIKKHGMELHAYFLVGFPFETEKSLNDSFEAMKKLKYQSHVVISIFTPYPGTELYEYCKENGIIDDDYDISLHNHQSMDCFCTNISQDRFKELVLNIEKFVDRNNKMYRLKRIFSLNTYWRLEELGLKNSIARGLKIIFTKK